MFTYSSDFNIKETAQQYWSNCDCECVCLYIFKRISTISAWVPRRMISYEILTMKVPGIYSIDRWAEMVSEGSPSRWCVCLLNKKKKGKKGKGVFVSSSRDLRYRFQRDRNPETVTKQFEHLCTYKLVYTWVYVCVNLSRYERGCDLKRYQNKNNFFSRANV